MSTSSFPRGEGPAVASWGTPSVSAAGEATGTYPISGNLFAAIAAIQGRSDPTAYPLGAVNLWPDVRVPATREHIGSGEPNRHGALARRSPVRAYAPGESWGNLLRIPA